MLRLEKVVISVEADMKDFQSILKGEVMEDSKYRDMRLGIGGWYGYKRLPEGWKEPVVMPMCLDVCVRGTEAGCGV